MISISNDGRTVLIENEARNADRIWKPLSGRMLRFDQTYAGGYAKPYTYTYGVAVSGNGDYVMFNSKAANIVRGDANRAPDVFVRNLTNGHTTRISQSNSGRQANGESYGTDISGNGRYRLFNSSATNLVRGDTNANADLFVRDSTLRTTTRCDVASDGSQANAGSIGGSLSGSGSWVAFTSASSNLVSGDTNGLEDVFVRGPFCG